MSCSSISLPTKSALPPTVRKVCVLGWILLVNQLVPSPSLRLRKLSDGQLIVWKSQGATSACHDNFCVWFALAKGDFGHYRVFDHCIDSLRVVIAGYGKPFVVSPDHPPHQTSFCHA